MHTFTKYISLDISLTQWDLYCITTITTCSVQFSSVTQSCPTLWDPMNCRMPGLPVHHQLPEFTPTHVYRVGDAIQQSHPLLSPSPPAPSPSQHQGLFQWVNSSHKVAKILEFQLQHQSFQMNTQEWSPYQLCVSHFTCIFLQVILCLILITTLPDGWYYFQFTNDKSKKDKIIQ